MSLVEYDDVVETFAAYCPDYSLGVRILPGRSWRSDDFFDAHVFHAFTEIVAVDRVAISEQKPRRFIKGETPQRSAAPSIGLSDGR